MTRTLADLLDDADARGAALRVALDARATTRDLAAVSWDHLRARASRVAGAFAARGLRGRPVLLVAPNGEALLAAWWGAILAGALPAVVTPPRAFADAEAWAVRLAGLHTACGDAPILAPAATAALLASTAAGAGLPTWPIDALDGPPHRLAGITADDPGILQLTSGSVGRPKGVVLTHGAVLANARGIAERAALTPDDVGGWWVPLAHDMALLAHLALTVGGCSQIVLPTDHFARNPAGWLTLCPGELSVSVGPPFAFELARQRLLRLDPPPDLSALRTLIVGAEPIDAAILRRFEVDLAPLGARRDLFMPSYGLAEMTCVIALGAAGAPLRTARVARPLAEGAPVRPSDAPDAAELVGHGPPLRDTEIRVVDGADRPVPDGTIGHVIARGPSALRGYWADPERTAETLADGGWIRTGDLGFRQADLLFVAGRTKDVILHRGRAILPEEIEELVGSVPGVRPRGALAFGVPDPTGGPERVVVVVEREAGARVEALTRAIRIRVADALDLPIDRVIAEGPGALPRTTSGKLQRGVARARWGAT